MKQTLKTNSIKTTLKCLIFAMLTFAFASCDDDDEQMIVKDYGLKTFSANYNYDSNNEDQAYQDQVYFSFTAEDSLVATYTYGEDGWTNFNIISTSDDYKITSDVEGWDLVFTNYTTAMNSGGTIVEHAVTGALINTKESIEVGFMEYTDYSNTDSISSAFVSLTLDDIDTISYSTDVDAIGYDWKTFNHSNYQYTANSNYFYFVKLDDETYYKLRFTGFYGSSSDERIATIQYQLMQ